MFGKDVGRFLVCILQIEHLWLFQLLGDGIAVLLGVLMQLEARLDPLLHATHVPVFVVRFLVFENARDLDLDDW